MAESIYDKIMARIIIIITILSTIPNLIQSGQQSTMGIVKSKSGKPISEVLVCTSSYACTKTDSDGRFDPSMIRPKEWGTSLRRGMFRFSKEGYKPFIETHATANDGFDVTLVEGHVIPWDIPACKGKDLRVGFNIKVSVPDDTQVSRVRDSDYETIAFKFGNTDEWMQIGSGPSWGTGLPFKEDVDNSVEILDRDIRFPLTPIVNKLSLDGIDVQGRLADGKRWRFAGHAFETLTYRNVSPAAAKFFDSIINGGCFQLSRKELK